MATKAVNLVTEVPGPKSRALLAVRQAHVPRGLFNVTPIFAERAEGARLTDVDGNTFLDFAGGIGVLNIGHSAPPVVAAARAQLERFTHTCFHVVPYEAYVAVAERLNRITPGGFPKKTALFNSGAEMDAPQVGGLGGTFGGNPVSCAAALAALDFIEREDLPGRAARIGARALERFQAMRTRYELIGDARGLGAMAAIELVRDRPSRAPAKEATNRVARLAFERGLILITAGTHGNIIRTLMPLVITDAELEEGMDILESAVRDVDAEAR